MGEALGVERVLVPMIFDSSFPGLIRDIHEIAVDCIFMDRFRDDTFHSPVLSGTC